MGNEQTEGSDAAIQLSLEELSARTGEPVERLSQWRSLGLIGGGDGALRQAQGERGGPTDALQAPDERFGPRDVERVRLVQLLLRRGISLEAIHRTAKELGTHLGGYLQLLFPQGIGRTYSLAEAAEMVGLSTDFLRQLQGVLWPGQAGQWVGEDDIQLLRGLRTALDAGLPENSLVDIARVYADALGRVAEAETRLFTFYAMRPLRDAGLSGRTFAEAYVEAVNRLYPLAGPVLEYFHRKGLVQAAREDVATNLAEEAGLLVRGEVPGQLRLAIVFVDLSSFTPLAEAMGDAKAAQVLQRFSTLVRESVARWDGSVAKQIGDAFMLVFPDARSAVACALEIESGTATEPQFPALRSGVHWGQVLYREGDYVGSNVNIASRLAGAAERHQVLLTEAARKEAGSLPGVEFARLGKRQLKGLAEKVVLFEARSAAEREKARAVDPVCGMELGAAEIAASLSLAGEERSFCSEECLRRFVASPERYSA